MHLCHLTDNSLSLSHTGWVLLRLSIPPDLVLILPLLLSSRLSRVHDFFSSAFIPLKFSYLFKQTLNELLPEITWMGVWRLACRRQQHRRDIWAEIWRSSKSLPEGQKIGSYLKKELHVQIHRWPECWEKPTLMQLSTQWRASREGRRRETQTEQVWETNHGAGGKEGSGNTIENHSTQSR